MIFAIDVQNERAYPIDDERLAQAAAVVLTQHDAAEDAGLSIVITADEDVQALNRQFRGIDAPTDVLSFPTEIPGAAGYLGDLIIAHPYALAQAQREGHAPQDSFDLLVVHGTLHLLGYDHDTPAHQARMWAHQAEALRQLGISTDIVPEVHDE
jgi:probable rRNA maturation factor